MTVDQARLIQQHYWMPNPIEKQHLLEKGIVNLAWPETLRLLHLVCLDLLSQGTGQDQLMSDETESTEVPTGEHRELLLQLTQTLLSNSSPYKARPALLWQGDPDPNTQRQADQQGFIRNASLTHLGCLEVIRLDANQDPTALDFIPFDDLRGMLLANPALFRYGKLFFDDGRPDEIVLIPILYGLSWLTPHQFDQDGTMTRFICHLELEDLKPPVSIGIGHQDLVVSAQDKLSLIGLGSMGEVMIALTLDDPKFDQKCRGRGLDPVAIRQSAQQ